MIEKMTNSSLLMTRQIIFFVAEQLTRACLHLDPGTRARLQAIAGKTVAIHIKDSLPLHADGIRVYVTPTAKGIDILGETHVSADATLTLYAKDLLLLVRNRLSEPNTISIEGDHELLLTVLDIVRSFDIDWEAAIAPVTGDIIAHHMGKNIRATEKWFTQSFNEAKRLAEEYVAEELPLAKQSGSFKPVFDQMEKMKTVSDSLRSKITDAAMKSPFFRPKNNK